MQEIYPEWIRRKIEEYRNWMIGVRRQLHRYPETGDQEYETTKYIQNLLEEMEFETNLGRLAHLRTEVRVTTGPGSADSGLAQKV